MRGALLLLAALCAAAPGAPAQSIPAQEAPASQFWGDAYYQAAADDSAGSTVSTSQEAGVSLNARSPAGLELAADFVVPLALDQEPSPQALVPQLYVRVPLASWASLSAGRQRLNWGTAKIFSAIDTVEVRASPLALHPVLPGVTGLKLDLLPDERLGVSIAALPAPDLRWSRGAARVELVLEEIGLDLGLGLVKYDFGGRSDDLAVLSDGALSLGDVVLYEEAQVRGGRDTGYFLPGMPAPEDLGGRGPIVLRADGGAMAQLDLGLSRPSTLVLEYLYNGDGLAADEARAFAARWNEWQAGGAPVGAQLPAAFAGLGGFRRHYAAAALRDVAVNRFFLVGLTGIVGIDSMLLWVAVDAAWEVRQGTEIALRYELGHAFLDPADQPTELLLSPVRNRLTLTVSTSY